MEFIERPSRYGSRNNFPEFIVVHAMGEKIDVEGAPSAASYLESVGLSAHALVAPSGYIILCRPEDKGAYHAKGFNSNSLGIEFLVEGNHNYGSFIEAIKKDYITEKQYKSGLDLIRMWMYSWDIQPNCIFRHSDLSPERKVDPGSGFPWDKLMKDIGGKG